MLLPTSIIALASLATVNAQNQPIYHICWIDRVEAVGPHVKIYFRSDGSPAAASAYSDGKELEIGSSFSIGNSGHDGCSITATRQGEEVGIEAKAWFRPPNMMTLNDKGELVWAKTETQVRTEWIAAQPQQ